MNPDRLRWALERSGRPPEDLYAKFPRLADWEAERSQPTLRQLQDFAKATYAPFGYLFADTLPDENLPIPHFRTVAPVGPTRPSPNLIETIQAMQRRQDWLRELLVEDGEPRVQFVGSATIDRPIDQLAIEIRDTLKLAEGWARTLSTWTAALTTLRDAIEEVGVMVVTNGVVGNNPHRKLDVSEFRGFVLVDAYAPLVFINGADAKAAQLFTLAHELAHLWFGQSAVFDLKGLEPAGDEIERKCNAVAAEFLVPRTELEQQWVTVAGLANPFDRLARHFKVSAIVVARRALDLSLIARQAFFEFYRQHLEEVQRRADASDDGGDFYRTQNVRLGKRFGSAVVHAVESGRITYRAAYALTGMWGSTFDNYVAELKGTRRR